MWLSCTLNWVESKKVCHIPMMLKQKDHGPIAESGIHALFKCLSLIRLDTLSSLIRIIIIACLG